MHALDEGAGLGDDLLGIGGEGAAEGDHGGIERVDRDVNHGREVPVDPRLAERGAHAPRLELRLRHVALVAKLLRRGRGQVAEASREPHDEAALVVGGDEQGAAETSGPVGDQSDHIGAEIAERDPGAGPEQGSGDGIEEVCLLTVLKDGGVAEGALRLV